MQLFDPNAGKPLVVQSRRYELVIEVLKFLTAMVAFVAAVLALTGRYQWLAKARVFESAFFVGIVMLVWLAKPRVTDLLKSVLDKRRDRQFIAAEDVRLRKLAERFNQFTSRSDSRSLVGILRSALAYEDLVIRTYGSGYISSWLDCYRKELDSSVKTLPAFLNRCQQFSAIVNEFNRNHVIPAQKQLEKGEAKVLEHYIDQLEGFREEFNAFLRQVEQWASDISDHARSRLGERAVVVTRPDPILRAS